MTQAEKVLAYIAPHQIEDSKDPYSTIVIHIVIADFMEQTGTASYILKQQSTPYTWWNKQYVFTDGSYIRLYSFENPTLTSRVELALGQKS